MAWSRAFQKCRIFYFLDNFFFANVFTIKLDFAKKSSIFANLQIRLHILKVDRAKKLSNDVLLSYLDIKQGIYMGGQIAHPPAYPGFQVPQQGYG